MKANLAIAQILIGFVIGVITLIAGIFIYRRARRTQNLGLRMKAYGVWIVSLLLMVVLLLPALAYLYTEHLWFESVGYANIFWGVLKSRWGLFAKFAAVAIGFMGLNLFVGARLCPVASDGTRWSREQTTQFYRTMLISIVLVASLLAVPMMFLWDDFIRYENRGLTDVITFVSHSALQKELGFYLFTFPIYRWGSLWLKVVLWTTIVIVGFLYHFYRRRDVRRSVRVERSFVFHASMLWLMLLGVSLCRSQINIWNVLYTVRTPWGLGRVDGMGYVDEVLIGATQIFMICIAGIGVLVLINMFWRKRLVWYYALAIWGASYIVLIQAYPIFVHWTEVRPNRASAEVPFLKGHIESTRQAFRLNQIVESDHIQGAATVEMIHRNPEIRENIQLWDRRVLYEVLRDKQTIKQYYEFHPYTDVDRYWIDGKYRQVLIAAREIYIDPKELPEAQYWDSRKMVYTHGYGVCVVPVNEFKTESADPNFWIKGIPMVSPDKLDKQFRVTKPQIYFGELTNDYIIVNTKKQLLFGIESEILTALDNGNLPQDLRQEFEAHEMPLSENVTISIKAKGRKWLITDKADEQEYVVSKEEGELRIYEQERWQLFNFKREKWLRFSIELSSQIELKFLVDLDKGLLSDDLRQKFEAQKTTLSEKVTISTKVEGSQWLITDKDNERGYIASKEAGELKIYKQKEVDPEGERFNGESGVEIGGWVRRLCFATRFDFWRIMLSKSLTPESRILFWRKIGTHDPITARTITDRLSHIAPFLKYDPDPYIVIGDDGQLWWMVDIYVTSRNYPNAKVYVDTTNLIENPPLYTEPTFDRFNYIRNPAIAVVNAYNGEVNFYLTKDEEPITAAYQSAFPNLFQQKDQIPAGLQNHLRYPDYLTRTQAEMYTDYHVEDAHSFFHGSDRWNIPDETYYTEKQRMVPYYATFKLPGEKKPEFVNMVPFTPPKRVKLLNAWLVARCDGAGYGQLVIYRLPTEATVIGPTQVEEDIENALANEVWFRQSDAKGAQVIRGNLLVIPVEDTLFYVEPIYLKPKNSNRAQLKTVVIRAGDQFAYADRFDKALKKIFGVGIGVESATETAEGTAGALPPLVELIRLANEKYDQYLKLTGEAKVMEAAQEFKELERILRALQAKQFQ